MSDEPTSGMEEVLRLCDKWERYATERPDQGAGYDGYYEGHAACASELRAALATPPGSPATPEGEAEAFIQAAVDRAPEPLRRLGEWLARVLDDDEWKTAERMLLGAALTPPASPSPAPAAVEDLREPVERTLALFFTGNR